MFEPDVENYEPNIGKLEPATDKSEPYSDKFKPGIDRLEPASDKFEPYTNFFELDNKSTINTGGLQLNNVRFKLDSPRLASFLKKKSHNYLLFRFSSLKVRIKTFN